MKSFNISLSKVQKSTRQQITQSPAILISIVNPGFDNPYDETEDGSKFKHGYVRVYNFTVADLLDDDVNNPQYNMRFNDDQAARMIEIINRAASEQLDIVVHCHMGISRSAAVTSVTPVYGYSVQTNTSCANSSIRRRLMEVIYDHNTSKKRGLS